MTSPAASSSGLSQPSLQQSSEGLELCDARIKPGATATIAKTVEANVKDSNASSGSSAVGEASTRTDEVQAPERPQDSALILSPKVGSRTGSILAFLALLSTSVFFALQYRQANSLAIVSNNLAIEESCRSHPNNTYLQNLAICQEAVQRNDFDIQKRYLQSWDQIVDTKSSEKTGYVWQPLATLERCFSRNKSRYHQISTQAILIVASFLIQETTQSLFLYLGVAGLAVLLWRLSLHLRWPARKANPGGDLKHSGSLRQLSTTMPCQSSSMLVRRQAWLTATQEAWMTRDMFFLEALTLCWKMLQLGMRNLLGSSFYEYLTGTTKDEEVTRVKAWTIALDAQLAGGDVFIRKTRLLLTLLASNTLPDTPTRLMLKALHIKILLWAIGNFGFNKWSLFRGIATKVTRWKWNEARRLQRLYADKRDYQEDKLPRHLRTLLEQSCDDVFVDRISQRAYNLAWNLPTEHKIEVLSDGMGDTVDDFATNDEAIRSPLDAIASWYSSLILQRVLTKSLESKENSLCDSINIATNIAPIGSRAQIRALVARTVLVKEERGVNIAEAIRTINSVQFEKAGGNEDVTPSLNIRKTALTGLPDVQISLQYAVAIERLERLTPPANPEKAHQIINRFQLRNHTQNVTLLGVTAAFELMRNIRRHNLVAVSCIGSLEKLAGTLRIWIGSKECTKNGLNEKLKKVLAERCLSVTKWVVSMEHDG